MTSHTLTKLYYSNVFNVLDANRMPAHWLMARLGKRVLRPGGVETTRWLLDHCLVEAIDDVVELAPGLGTSARTILERGPRSYVGIERDETAKLFAERAIRRTVNPRARVVLGNAAHVPLPSGSASLVFGEAMLSMQPPQKKSAIIAEARRLLRPGGRYAIHELAVTPNTIDSVRLSLIHKDLSRHIHVGVCLGTVEEWIRWIEAGGFEVESIVTRPMRLLEPDRLLRDEGFLGAVKFVFNALRTPGAARRLLHLQACFRRYQASLCAVGIVARVASE